MKSHPSDAVTVKHRVEAIPVRALRVEVIEGPDAGRTATAEGETVSVGTAADNELVLTDATVSRYHLELGVQGGRIVVSDLGSTNGTTVSSVRLDKGSVPSGTVLALGKTRLRVDEGSPRVVELVSAFGGLKGRSPAMRRLMAAASKAAASTVSTLLIGESGTGKEVFARAIHDEGPRARGPFVTVDCGSLSPTLISSELFGHEKGAFTGADQQHPGAFERANGGTIFLDEIGELPMSLQPTLLGVLERRTFRRLGGKVDLTSNVRVVAATNRDLRAEVNSGRFRLDLYFRLAVVRLEIPPLRARRDDIPSLVEHFLTQAGHPGPMERVIDADQLDRLKEHSWPGNVRELRNFVEAAVAMGEAPALDQDGGTAAGSAGGSEVLGAGVSELLEAPYKEARQTVLTRFETLYLPSLLKRANGNIAQAARLARMDRSHLFDLLERHKLR